MFKAIEGLAPQKRTSTDRLVDGMINGYRCQLQYATTKERLIIHNKVSDRLRIQGALEADHKFNNTVFTTGVLVIFATTMALMWWGGVIG